MSEQVRTFTVTEEDDGIRLDRWFRRNLPDVAFGQVSRWARTGQLRLDGKRAAPGDRVEAGQSVRVPPQTEEVATAVTNFDTYTRKTVTTDDIRACLREEHPGPRIQDGLEVKPG